MTLNYKFRTWVGNTPPSYLESLRFEVSPYSPALLIEISCEFYVLFRIMAEYP